jgi:phosphatidylinositol-3,4,5-trisphosphate 3-phosphatase and dual-specificity protein phosphatase PTEN
MAGFVRSVVSKKKKRFVEDGFDLDLTYITPNIIAMGFPSSGVEGIYRNPLPEVQRFFAKRHAGHYKVIHSPILLPSPPISHRHSQIYNLCSERSYDLEGLFDCVEVFPFDDHNPCALKLIETFCSTIYSYLNADRLNVVAIHCKAGKGRTGTMIASYLLHSGICQSAEDALAMFGRERTHNGKGVTIPSQIRYVHYYENLLRRRDVISYTFQITHIRLITVPNFDPSITGGGCDPYLIVKMLFPIDLQTSTTTAASAAAAGGGTSTTTSGSNIYKQKTIFNQFLETKKVKKYYPSEKCIDMDLSSSNVKIRGDVNLMFYDHDVYSSDDKMCQIWINTAFIEKNYLIFDKSVIDRACKDKYNRAFDADFKIEIYLHRVEDDDINIASYAEDEGEGDEGDDDDEEEG